MRTVRCSRLFLLLFHHLFLLIFISITCTRADSGYLLKDVTLNVKPANTVEHGSALTLTCIAKVIYSVEDSPLLQFSFFKDYDKYNIVHMFQSNSSNNVTYTITKARASHSGTYQCDVRTSYQYKESLPEQITVNGLQTPTLSVDKTVVTEGDVVRITCSAKDESGELTFIIKEGEREIYHGKSTSGEVQKNHSLMSVGTARLSCSYIINLVTRTLTSNESNTLVINLKELSFVPVITTHPSTEVIEGDSVDVTCRVDGSFHTSALLTLSKGTFLLYFGNNTEYKTSVRVYKSETYECSALVNNVEKSVHASLTVKELFSTPVLKIFPAEVFEKQQFTVTCSSSAFAVKRIGRDDVKYTIYRNNQMLKSVNGTYRAMADTGTNGDYACTAHVNDTIKWSSSIHFRSKVLVSKPNITVLDKVVLGRPFRIKCYSKHGSFPITYTLKQNHSVVKHTRVSGLFEEAIFNASIHSENEIQEFRCEAQNNGRDSVQISDLLRAPVTVPVGDLTLITLPVVDDVTEDDDVKFLCVARKGTPPITFKWYQDENRSPLHTDTVHESHSMYTLRSISGVHRGRYYCEALNVDGKQEVSNDIMVTVKMAMWKKGLIIGTCLLCVTVLVLALLIRCRAKRVKVSEINGAGIWSVRPPGLDSNEVLDLEEPEEPNVEYTEVLHPQSADPTRVPLRKGTDTVYSEVRVLDEDKESCEY